MSSEKKPQKEIWRKIGTDKHITAHSEHPKSKTEHITVRVWEIHNDEDAVGIMMGLFNLAGRLGIIDRRALKCRQSSSPYVKRTELRYPCKLVTVRTQPISSSS